MKLTRNVVFNPALFNVVPMVNVLFLLLAFYALSSSFVFQPGISVNPPPSSFLLGPRRSALIVSIVSAPATQIYFRDRRTTIDQLAASLADPDIANRTLIVKADRRTAYEEVMRVMNLGLENGFSVVLAASEPERK